MPREQRYPALVKKFCRACGARGEIVVISRDQGRNHWYCSDECRSKQGTAGRRTKLDKERPDAEILQKNVPLPDGFVAPVFRDRTEYYEKNDWVEKQKAKKKAEVVPKIMDRDAVYRVELRKHYGLRG